MDWSISKLQGTSLHKYTIGFTMLSIYWLLSFIIGDKTTKIEMCVFFLTKMFSAIHSFIHSFNEQVFTKHHQVPGTGLNDVDITEAQFLSPQGQESSEAKFTAWHFITSSSAFGGYFILSLFQWDWNIWNPLAKLTYKLFF